MYPNVTIKNTSFEAWGPQKVDLVISAQAFDWIPPEIAYKKAAASLKGSGSLALFRNDIPPADTDVSFALDAVRQRAAPHLAQQMKAWDIWSKRAENNMKRSKLFKKSNDKSLPVV